MELAGVLGDHENVARGKDDIGVESIRHRIRRPRALDEYPHARQVSQFRAVILNLDKFVALCPGGLTVIVDFSYS